ncbi:MAG: hypothetical protein WCK47_10715 [bacterium]
MREGEKAIKDYLAQRRKERKEQQADLREKEKDIKDDFAQRREERKEQQACLQ